jgi:hypothetical protein
VRQLPNRCVNGESGQHRPAGRIQAIAADFFARKLFALEQEGLNTRARAKGGAGRSSRSASDNGNIEHSR